MKIILASSSPRRKELLAILGHDICVIPALVQEESLTDFNYSAAEVALKNAVLKTNYVFENYGHINSDVILGADTVVNINDEILGKPKNKDQAITMLAKLSGKSHEVITGYCLIGLDNKITQNHVISQVTFRELNNQEIVNYVEWGESLDKAGAYGIQGAGAALISSISGSVTNIIGLPVERVLTDIEELMSDK